MPKINPKELKLDKSDKKKCNKAFLGRCPASGGMCANPVCLFGCIDDYNKPVETKEN